MNVLERFSRALGVLVAPESSNQSPASLMGSGASRGDPPKRGTAELLQAYSTMPWLRAVTSKVGFAVGMTRWKLFAVRSSSTNRFIRNLDLQKCPDHTTRKQLMDGLKKQGELVEIENNPALSLIHDVNPHHTGLTGRKLLQNYVDLTGEWIILMEMDAAFKVPIALWPIPTHWVRETPRPGHPFFEIAFDGAHPVSVPEALIIWSVDADPFNPYRRGSSLSGTLSDELETSEYAQKHAKNFFWNRARPDFVAYVEPKSGESDVDQRSLRRLQQRWMDEHQGFWKSVKPHFTNRKMDIHEFEQDTQKQSLLPIMEHERDTIIHVFGFPPEIFGILESSNRATIEAADFLFSRYAVVPRLEFMRQNFQQSLIPFFDERLILEYESPVTEDKTVALDAAKSAPWTIEVDEYREKFMSLEPLEEDKGKVFAVPLNISLTEDLLTDLGLDEPEEPPADDPPEEFALNWLAEYAKAKQVNDPSYILVHRIADRLEPAMKKAFLAALKTMRGKIDLTATANFIGSRNLSAAVDSLPWDVLSTQLDKRMIPEIRRVLSGVGSVAAQQLGASLGTSEVSFDISSANVTRWLRDHGADMVSDITEASREGIRRALARAFEGDLSPSELAKQIQRRIGLTDRDHSATEKFEQGLRERGVSEPEIKRRIVKHEEARLRRRSRNIARTETIRAGNAGQQLTWEQAVEDGNLPADNVRRIWIVTPDDRLDVEICEPMEGQRVRLSEPFVTPGGNSLPFPPAHPLCRCAVGLEFVNRRGKTIRIIPKWLIFLAMEERN